MLSEKERTEYQQKERIRINKEIAAHPIVLAGKMYAVHDEALIWDRIYNMIYHLDDFRLEQVEWPRKVIPTKPGEWPFPIRYELY